MKSKPCLGWLRVLSVVMVGGRLQVSAVTTCSPVQSNAHRREKWGAHLYHTVTSRVPVSVTQLEGRPWWNKATEMQGEKTQRQRRNNIPLSSDVHSMRPCLCIKYESGWDHTAGLPVLCFNHPNLAFLAFDIILEYIGLIFKGNKHLQLPLTLVAAADLKINLR